MITSVRNRQVVAAASLKKRGLREQYRRFLAEGVQAAAEAIDAGMAEALFHVPGAGGRIDGLVARAAENGVRTTAVSEQVMTHLTSTVTPQAILAVASFVDRPLEEIPLGEGMVAVLCSVRDPGNAGTILRSADAAGASAVVFTAASVDVYNPKAVRASAGSLFHLPIAREAPVRPAVELLRRHGARVLAATADGERSVYETDLTGPTAILFGNEAWGLPHEVHELADGSVRVPIRGRAESLNLAAAAALALFESARQRSGHRVRGDAARLISSAAHDLRRPLTGLRGFATTLVDRWDALDEDRRRESVRWLSLDAERTAALVEIVVWLARLEANGRISQGDPEDVAAAVRWLEGVFARAPELPDLRWTGSATSRVSIPLLRALVLAVADAVSAEGRGPVEIRVGDASGGAIIDIRRAGAGGRESDAGREGTVLELAGGVLERIGGGLDPTAGGFRLRVPA